MMDRTVEFDLQKLSRDDESHFEMLAMSVEEARNLLNNTEGDDDFVTALDEAQGAVMTGEAQAAYLIIKIG